MHRNVLAALFLLVLTLILTSSVMAVTRNERGALKLLYWATQGQRWVGRWAIQNEHSDPCIDSWFGIVCDRYGRIQSMYVHPRLDGIHVVKEWGTHLDTGEADCQTITSWGSYHQTSLVKISAGCENCDDLSSNFLTGYVPDTLSRLSALRTLRLDRNYFVGAIPSSLAQLTKLEFLWCQSLTVRVVVAGSYKGTTLTLWTTELCYLKKFKRLQILKDSVATLFHKAAQ
ncbi:Leucine-rich repeat receptor-like protein kinase PEPR1 [Phytophthora citrophthora]|uniref:Leucine-rich repeat receptor-like protein kinase PEPR1 n=1 Tax=Phytophthora citrophthora TaxID=4793 RepID=A0AAD9LDQ2_9STRA|nr:Leucine-rich repeat receptor-like protein kinase PEPR1 [Phytophthora citrophthora]